jgi:choline kinase
MYIACLMAGKSSRLLPRTKTDHKAMLKLGDLRVIDAQLQTFALAGIDTFSFVIGHGGIRLANHLLTKYSTLAISVINNNYFTARNLDWSAYLALSSRPGDVIYYEGDLIASPSIIRQVATHRGDVCVAMDPRGQSEKIDARVVGENDRVVELRLSEHGNLVERDATQSEGEFVCLVKLSDRARRYVIHSLERESYGGPMRLYGIFNDLFRHYPSFLVSTAGRPWVEIDNKTDLLRATQTVHRILRPESLTGR